MKRSIVAAICCVGVAVLCGAFSCTPADTSTQAASNTQPNVLLVTFDTTRADHLGPFGAKNAFTPTLNALARGGFKFNRAFANVSVTQPSHTTIMTGLYPHYHGVRDNSHFVLKPEAVTLAEVLKENGYQTAAFVAAFVLDGRFGLNQGFDVYDDHVRPRSEFEGFRVPERNGEAITGVATAWLDKADRDKPFFVWAHYYDPHAPYDAPESFTRYQGHAYDVEIAYADMQFGRLLKHVEQISAQTGRETLIVFAADHGEALEQYGEPTHAYFCYDSTLHVPLILRLPDGSHAGGETDTIVTLADIYPTVLDVLGLPVPGPEDLHGRSLRSLIETGNADSDLIDRPIALESYEPHYGYGWTPIEGVRIGDLKYLDTPKPELYDLAANPRETPANNLYDKQPDLAAQMKAAYRDLFDGTLSSPSLASAPESPDADVIEKMRALGYVAAAIPEDHEIRRDKDLKDMLPYYRRSLNAMSLVGAGEAGEAAELLVQLHNEEPENPRVLWMLAELASTTPWIADVALPSVEQAIKTPGMVAASMLPQMLLSCGRIHMNKGDDEQAIEYFADAMDAQDDYAGAAWWKGLAALRLGRNAEAIEAMTTASKLFGPNVSYVQAALGMTYFVNGQPDEGSRVWTGVLDKWKSPEVVWLLAAACPLDPEIAARTEPLLRPYVDKQSLPQQIRAALGIACSNFLAIQGNHRGALETLEHIRPLLPKDDIGINIAMGRQHMRLGDAKRARELLESCYDRASDRVEVVTALASLMEQDGQIDEAVGVLEKLYQRYPEDVSTLNNLAWMLARQGKDLDRALRLAKRALKKKGNDPSVNDTTGWIHRARGEIEAAIPYVRRATRMDPHNGEYQYHLGMLYKETGRAADAREAFKLAVESAPQPRPDWYEQALRESDDTGA